MTLLSELPTGRNATVVAVESQAPSADPLLLQRLADLGFIAGEPVRVLRRGPGGREPLAVQIGETLFGLRLHEARCIRVEPV
ncbi:MAG: ferrous iron transport protein A [Proteobacteria bacterium]|nr:ferrous iron transport protein A [Pseudomonadota bacterium]